MLYLNPQYQPISQNDVEQQQPEKTSYGFIRNVFAYIAKQFIFLNECILSVTACTTGVFQEAFAKTSHIFAEIFDCEPYKYTAESFKVFEERLFSERPLYLRNIGNSCYISAVLQLLFSVCDSELTILAKKQKIIEREKNQRDQARDGLRIILSEIFNLKNSDYKNNQDQMQLRKFRAFLFSSGLHPEFHVEKIYNQHDASALLEVLLKVTNATSLKMQQTLYKSNENKTLQKELKFTLLPLPIKEIHKNVLDLVKDYFNNQPATEEKCLFEGDQEKAPYNTQMQLIQVPSLLVVHLLRFNNDLNKINHPITLSPTIDLKEFVIPSLTADIQYEMTGYITHENNSIYSGHYVAYVKRGEYYWRCNDMLPSPVESITQEEFFNYKSAYLVLFKRSNL